MRTIEERLREILEKVCEMTLDDYEVEKSRLKVSIASLLHDFQSEGIGGRVVRERGLK